MGCDMSLLSSAMGLADDELTIQARGLRLEFTGVTHVESATLHQPRGPVREGLAVEAIIVNSDLPHNVTVELVPENMALERGQKRLLKGTRLNRLAIRVSPSPTPTNFKITIDVLYV